MRPCGAWKWDGVSAGFRSQFARPWTSNVTPTHSVAFVTFVGFIFVMYSATARCLHNPPIRVNFPSRAPKSRLNEFPYCDHVILTGIYVI